MNDTETKVIKAALRWYRARRPSNWDDGEQVDYRDASMGLKYTADFELMDAVAELVDPIRSSIEKITFAPPSEPEWQAYLERT